MLRIAIIGGGAAGFFTAINLKELLDEGVDVTILEASDKVLSKVRVSGGGRCNLTNTFAEVSQLSKAYPRGEKIMRRAFKKFGWRETYNWFEEHGVPLTVQDDECIFPESQSSEDIIRMFGYYCAQLGVNIKTSMRVGSIEREESGFTVKFTAAEDERFDIVVVTTGGSSSKDGYSLLSSLPVELKEPKPSLFTLNISDGGLTDMMGVVAPNAVVGIAATKFRAQGAMLITHWGISGPATLKLSSYAAEYLHAAEYCVPIVINWIGESNEESVMAELEHVKSENSKKLVGSARPYLDAITARMWQHILSRGAIDPTRRWGDISRKSLNTMVRTLTCDLYHSCGKAKHKEEFVTCGGVDLNSINPTTLEAKECEGLYFAGEVLDIDAITGGFNLQAAWSTGYTVAHAIAKKVLL